MGQAHTGLHEAEAGANAIAGTIAKGQPTAGWSSRNLCLREALWLKLLWLGVDVGIVVYAEGWYHNYAAFLNIVFRIPWRIVRDGLACQMGQHGIFAKSFYIEVLSLELGKHRHKQAV